MAVKPVKYSYTGYPVYRDGDFNLNRKPNSRGIIRTECPIGDHKHHDRRLSIDINSGFLWCFDPECCQMGILESYYDKWLSEHEKKYIKAFNAKPILDEAIDICSPAVLKYLREERGFTDLSVFKKLGIKEIDHWYGKDEVTGLDDIGRSLCFPFYMGDKVLNIQFKRADGIKAFRHGKGVRIPYNINSLIGQDTVIITEGQMDCAALVSCGFESTISMPNGSNSLMECFDEVEQFMTSAGEFIFAVDNDTPGVMLRNKLYEKFGAKYNCYYISFKYHDRDVPEDKWFEAKDANECLKLGGVEAVKWCMAHKLECLSPHIITADSVAEKMDDIFFNGLPQGVTLGLGKFDHYVKFMTRQLYIVTGMPSSGKTNLIDFWITRLAYLHGWKSTVFSPEKDPEAHFNEYVHRIVGRKADVQHMSYEKYTSTRCDLSKMITHMVMGRDNTIDKILDTAAQEVRKRGIKVLVIDPFNYIRLSRDTAWSESGAINDLLIQLKVFAQEHDILIILMAHPKKTMDSTDGQAVHLHMYDISGSASFYNVSDMGIIIRRERRRNYTEVCVEKAREHGRMGDEGMAYLWYSGETARYASAEVNGDIEHNIGVNVEYKTMDKSDWSSRAPEQLEMSFEPSPEDDLPF